MGANAYVIVLGIACPVLFIICVVLIFCVRFFNQRRNQEPEQEQEETPLHNRTETLQKQVSLNQLKESTCIICLQEFGQGNSLCYFPCLHYFHKQCIENWIQNHKICPVCRNDVDVELENQVFIVGS